LLRAFMVAISSMVYKASAIENFATEEVRKVVLKAHRRILEAIVAKDAELRGGAWRVTSAH
jgi:DNA-binding FadR family transcriptional regulator